MGVEIPLAAVSEQGYDGSLPVIPHHSLRHRQRSPQVCAGRWARLAPDQFFQPEHRGNAGGVRHLDHVINYTGLEGMLDLRPSDPLDPAGSVGDKTAIARHITVVENRAFGIDDLDFCIIALVPDVAAKRRRRAAGACRHDQMRGNWGGLMLHLREYAFGDLVVAAPVRRAFGISELVHEVAADVAGQHH